MTTSLPSASSLVVRIIIQTKAEVLPAGLVEDANGLLHPKGIEAMVHREQDVKQETNFTLLHFLRLHKELWIHHVCLVHYLLYWMVRILIEEIVVVVLNTLDVKKP